MSTVAQLDPASLADRDEARFRELLGLLRQVGIVLPPDTQPEEFLESLRVAVKVLAAAKVREEKAHSQGKIVSSAAMSVSSKGECDRIVADILAANDHCIHQAAVERERRVDQIVAEQLDAEKFGIWGAPTQRLRHGQPV